MNDISIDTSNISTIQPYGDISGNALIGMKTITNSFDEDSPDKFAKGTYDELGKALQERFKNKNIKNLKIDAELRAKLKEHHYCNQ